MARNSRNPPKGWNQLSSPVLYSREHNRLTKERFATLAEQMLLMPIDEVKTHRDYASQNSIVAIVAGAVIVAKEHGNFILLDKLLDRVIGKVTQNVQVHVPDASGPSQGASFVEFCERAGYPVPYNTQIDMMEFGMHLTMPRMLLGARGYGKTDYVVILGVAYSIYCDQTFTALLMTKNKDRNTAIMNEVYKALCANGIEFDQNSAGAIRVSGLKGKDPSLGALTLGASVRGRHPRMVIMDDPVTEEDVSEATRKKVQRKYNELTKLTSNILIIGQPVHKFDLYETLRPLLNCMEVPHGTIPELDHDLEAQRLAGVSEESIQASYFLKVISETGYPLEKVKYIDEFTPGDCVAFIDPSYEGGDYTALTCLRSHFQAVQVKGRCWKRAWYDCLDEIVEELLKCGVKRLAFETNNLGDQPVTILSEMLYDTGIGVVGRRSVGPKHARIVAAGVFAPMIHVAKTSDRIWIEQVVRYEYKAKNDDAPDSLASLLEWVGLIRGRDVAV